MADSDRTYTEVEHVAIVADAVSRENASLLEANAGLETKVSELTGKVAALEAEKATLSSELETEKAAHSDFKTQVERANEIEALKSEREAAVKDANPALPETHFTPERVLSWAEMNADTFQVVVDSIKASAGTPVVVRESAAFKGGAAAGTDGAAEGRVAGRFLTVGREN